MTDDDKNDVSEPKPRVRKIVRSEATTSSRTFVAVALDEKGRAMPPSKTMLDAQSSLETAPKARTMDEADAIDQDWDDFMPSEEPSKVAVQGMKESKHSEETMAHATTAQKLFDARAPRKFAESPPPDPHRYAREYAKARQMDYPKPPNRPGAARARSGFGVQERRPFREDRIAKNPRQHSSQDAVHTRDERKLQAPQANRENRPKEAVRAASPRQVQNTVTAPVKAENVSKKNTVTVSSSPPPSVASVPPPVVPPPVAPSHKVEKPVLTAKQAMSAKVNERAARKKEKKAAKAAEKKLRQQAKAETLSNGVRTAPAKGQKKNESKSKQEIREGELDRILDSVESTESPKPSLWKRIVGFFKGS